jgi:hypothetical protein
MRSKPLMRTTMILLLVGAVLAIRPATAYNAEDPANCNGVDWDNERCPVDTEACRKKSYLVNGDLVLTGKTRGSFTCVSHQALQSKSKAIWTTGWLPSAALAPLTPTPAPSLSDWIGSWEQPHGGIEIMRGGIGGRLQIEGEMVVPTADDSHTGVISAQVMPRDNAIAFLDDGWLPFETKCDSGCRVRMQRIGPFLLVEDNGDCGAPASPSPASSAANSAGTAPEKRRIRHGCRCAGVGYMYDRAKPYQ